MIIKYGVHVFFDLQCVMHYEYFSASPTLNKEYKFSVLKRLRDGARRKRPESDESTSGTGTKRHPKSVSMIGTNLPPNRQIGDPDVRGEKAVERTLETR